ncbi:MAG TPA: substrate-binding domain-containing protein [Acidimicrobiales bacterium]|nr:substrate-binding domain-containing protein [Acidimicrobiales bacterium]
MRRRPTALRVLAVSLVATAGLSACGDRDQRDVALPECLDLGAVYALTGPESVGDHSWDDTAPLAEDLGSPVAADLPDAPLTIFGPGEESGTFDSFTELAIEGLAEERGVEEDNWLPRPDYISSPNDNVIIDGVAGTAGSFGWVGHAFAEDNEGTIRSFAVAGEDGRCVEPTDRAIASGEYPLARDLFIYVNLERAQDDPAVAAYVDRYLGEEGLAAVAQAGYVPLGDQAWEETRATWAEAGGSPGEPDSGVDGDVLVSGSSTVEPISSLVAEGFSQDNPSAGVSVDGPGTGDGFERFCEGETDISDASRPIEEEEVAACAEAGIEYVELKVGIDGLSLVTRS